MTGLSTGMKNNHNTAPNFVTPQANNTLPLPGAAKHNPPMAYTTVGSLASFNHRKQFGQEGLGAESEGLVGIFNSNAPCKVCKPEAVFS
jgi:hypothetical protein